MVYVSDTSTMLEMLETQHVLQPYTLPNRDAICTDYWAKIVTS